MTRWSSDDLARLEELRTLFLAGSRDGSPLMDYWSSERDLEIYDQTLGERIVWKWRAVFDELRGRGWKPSGRVLLDWACGSGAASRAYLEEFGCEGVEAVHLADRSALAVDFARSRLAGLWPELDVRTDVPANPSLVLISHVLGELPAEGGAELHERLRGAGELLWVDAGSRELSRRLSAERERWRATHAPFAPCTHSSDCGVLAPGNDSQWCHFFARSPTQVYTEGHWDELHRRLGIDRRSLAYSFLGMRAHAVAEGASGERDAAGPEPRVDAGWGRLLGRPRLQKGRALVDACDASGVHARVLLQRADRKLFRELRDAAGRAWILRWRVQGERLEDIERAEDVDALEDPTSEGPLEPSEG